MRALYICYFGLLEPLVQTQVLPYLRGLAAAGNGIHLLTFEPSLPRACGPADERAAYVELAAHGICWHHLPYHKRPSLPSTMYDILAGAVASTRIVRTNRIGLVHARAHVACAMGLLVRRLTGARLLFDIRGFNPEEYVEAGVWSASSLSFRLSKRAERAMLNASDGFVVLTEAARRLLFGDDGGRLRGRPLEVIPCCVDAERFSRNPPASRQEVRAELKLGSGPILVYVGALGGSYLTNEIARLAATTLRTVKDSRVLILTQSDRCLIERPLRALGVDASRVLVCAVSPLDVPRYLAAADVAVSLIRPGYSKRASSPTKIAEYLASGLPVMVNPGIGDVDEIVQGNAVGVVLQSMTEEGYESAVRTALDRGREPGFADHARSVARTQFDLGAVGVARYLRMYACLCPAPESPLCREEVAA